jgi:CRISPR/Cas system CSM-associated protein Csm2 small subunit
LVSEDKGGEGTAEEESQGTAEQAAEQAALGTAVSGDGGSRAEMRKKSETWEEVFFQVKKARGVFAKQALRHLKRSGGSSKY